MAKRTGKSLLCRRYAQALFEHASEQNEVKQAGDELASLVNILQESTELQTAFFSPSLPATGVANAVEALLKQAGALGMTVRFCRLLAENRRLQLLPEISAVYHELLAESLNETTAEVTSATELAPKHVQDIAASLKSFTGKKINIVKKVDPSLLGGFTVRIGSRMLDGSLSGKLARIEQYLKKASN